MTAFMLCASVHAYAGLFRHVDRNTGAITLSNVPLPAQPDETVKKEEEPRESRFPVVPRRVQSLRDADRRTILLVELDLEKRALAHARGSGAPAEDVHRHVMNIAALEREIKNTR